MKNQDEENFFETYAFEILIFKFVLSIISLWFLYYVLSENLVGSIYYSLPIIFVALFFKFSGLYKEIKFSRLIYLSQKCFALLALNILSLLFFYLFQEDIHYLEQLIFAILHGDSLKYGIIGFVLPYFFSIYLWLGWKDDIKQEVPQKPSWAAYLENKNIKVKESDWRGNNYDYKK